MDTPRIGFLSLALVALLALSSFAPPARGDAYGSGSGLDATQHPFGESPVRLFSFASGFRSFVSRHLAAGDVLVILFFSRHCPHCVRFKETYRALADAYGASDSSEKNGVFFGAMDAGAVQGDDGKESIWEILREFSVAFIPDVRIFAPLHLVRKEAAVGGGSVVDLGAEYANGGLPAWTLLVPNDHMTAEGIAGLIRAHISTENLEKMRDTDRDESDTQRSRLSLLQMILKNLSATCPSAEFSPVRPFSSSSLCQGRERWAAETERLPPPQGADFRLHDALAVLQHTLQRWTVAGDALTYLTAVKERSLSRFLEVARYALPGRNVKGAVFRLLLLLHEKGSGLQPLPPGALSEELIVDAQAAAAAPTGGGAEGDGARASRATQAAEDASEAEGDVLRLTPALQKAVWSKALGSLAIAGVSGEDASAGVQLPALRHCTTLLCGVWSLLHIIAEGMHVQFTRRVALAKQRGRALFGEPRPPAAEAARGEQKEGDAGAAGAEKYELSREEEEKKAEEEEKPDIHGLQFFGPYDSLAVYAAEKYKHLLASEKRAQSEEKESTQAAGRPAAEETAEEGRRRHAQNEATAQGESEAAYMVDALEEVYGPLGNKRILKTFEAELVALETRFIVPAIVVQASMRDWIFSFFTCIACRSHFLECFERGFYGREEVSAPAVYAEETQDALESKRTRLRVALERFFAGKDQPGTLAAKGEAEAAAGDAGAAAGGEKERLLEGLPASVWLSREFFVVRDGLEVAEEAENLKHLQLWLWRLHNAVSVRTAVEATVETLWFSEGARVTDSHAAESQAADEPLGVGELAKRGLNFAYFLRVDPRWPPAQLAASCRVPARKPFLLTPEYVAAKGASEAVPLCENVDFTDDFDLEEVRQWLKRTYWNDAWAGGGTGPADEEGDGAAAVDLVFDGAAGAFRASRPPRRLALASLRGRETTR
ncbi:hypothetical protein BESB_053130 [Besnoitia besnoiti]|uniref:Thioredoxin domain-containing protein n=1 Tax=Besnoitia besnoiti TaxID=94643 RepID=A0A2A9MJU7_BESBE|nr:hypothetical protein BESB_053130 [Besnoitia besnoiti]PFH35662.1 hypothetical protein BESB_053130 [Besnoitia besnoiti]